MGTLPWTFRCVPGIAFLCLLNLSISALGGLEFAATLCQRALGAGENDFHRLAVDVASFLRTILAFYILAIHVLACAFPLRLLWALLRSTRQIARYHSSDGSPPHRDIVSARDHIARHSETGTPFYSTRNLITNDGLVEASNVSHAILIPSYKEDRDTLKDTLDVLASHPVAQHCYDVFLAMEEKDPNAMQVANSLIMSFSSRFRTLCYTIHPYGLPGQVQGKSSNISWAAQFAAERYRDQPTRSRTMITVLDSDTHLHSSYFIQLAYLLLKDLGKRSPQTPSIYVPPLIFDRNAHQVPAFVRMADLLWCGASLSCVYPGSSICIPTSVYSISLALACQVGGWDTGPESIGEDLHMFLKCYFMTGGKLRAKPIYSPASQCNVSTAERGVRGWSSNMRARWHQALRHMWGSLDTGYAISQGLNLLKKERESDVELGHGRWSLVLSHLFLAHRMFEAHFLPLHLPSCAIISFLYAQVVPRFMMGWPLVLALDGSAYLRRFSFILTMCWLHLYENYHAFWVNERESEMRRAGLYDEARFSHRSGARYWVDYFLFPVAGFVFGSIPAAYAQLWHFWTDRLVYRVAEKPRHGGDFETKSASNNTV